MSVWYCIPAARAWKDSTLPKWKERGYKLAVWKDSFQHDLPPFTDPSIVLVGEYPGYAKAVNALIKRAMDLEPEADWFVTGGDDVEPDMNKSPEEIAGECSAHFAIQHSGLTEGEPLSVPAMLKAFTGIEHRSFGIMQPTGDRWADDRGPYIERICGSPWLGREWCRRGHQGAGPLHPDFRHMYVDECLQNVAMQLGILWQRPDLIHLHQHWGRSGWLNEKPAHLIEVNKAPHWQEAKAIYDRIRNAGYAECLPLAL